MISAASVFIGINLTDMNLRLRLQYIKQRQLPVLID